VAEKTLLEKLLLKPGVGFALVNAPKGQKVPEGAKPIMRGAAEAVLFYVASQAELEASWGKAVAKLADGGRLWVAYPKAGKLGTDLNRDVLAKAVIAKGFDPVRQVALDDTWSALWFKR
jgi:hypothetical protein